MRLLIVCAIAICSWSGGFAQQAPPAGEKAIISPQPAASAGSNGHQPWFYLTRVTPIGVEERVPASYVFSARSKAYINVLPMQDGYLAVFAGPTSDLKTQQLFYPAGKNGKAEGELIRKGENIKVPIMFDDNPGETKFTVVLIAPDDRRGKILDLVLERSPQASLALKRYLEGGKGVIQSTDDAVPRFQPPVTWSSLSVKNR